VTRAEDTAALLAELKGVFPSIDILIANATSALTIKSLDDYTERGFMKSMRGGAWPAFDYLTQIHSVFGRWPKHVVIMSSDGPDSYTPNYDFVAAAKSALETLVRYFAYRLRDEGVRINVLRSRAIRTESFDETFGGEFFDFIAQHAPPAMFTTPKEVAEAALALCSGMFDGMSGQVIQVDKGAAFADGISLVYGKRLDAANA
jgi:enoyl-[acyl-carrier-protein] reductase (NADH)